MRWCIKMTNIRLGERNNFLRECVCSLKVYAAARSFHSVPCFSRRQPSFYGLFVFIPNLPITVSPLSNFADKKCRISRNVSILTGRILCKVWSNIESNISKASPAENLWHLASRFDTKTSLPREKCAGDLIIPEGQLSKFYKKVFCWRNFV